MNYDEPFRDDDKGGVIFQTRACVADAKARVNGEKENIDLIIVS